MISAKVPIPVGHLDAGPVEVHAYKLHILVLHAVRRLIIADQELLAADSHGSNQQRQVAQDARAQAMLELVFLFDLHLAAHRAMEAERNDPRSHTDSEWEQARSRREHDLSMATQLSDFGLMVYYSDSALFLDLYDFVERHTSPNEVVQELCSFVQTECKTDHSTYGHIWLHVIEDFAGVVLHFLKLDVCTVLLP